MPSAKKIGAVTNSWISGVVAAFRVIVEVIGKLTPLTRENSEAM